MNEMSEREQDAVILTGGRRLRSAGIHLGHWKFDEYVDAAVREFDRLTAERDAARDKINAIVAWAESCDESANNPDVDADVAHDRKESVRDIYRLLGIEITP